MKEWSNKIYNNIKSPAVRFCVNNQITANEITLVNHFVTLTAGCYFFSRGTWECWNAGLVVCLINGFLDYLDGDVARETKQFSKLGIWLDSGFDVIIQNAVMAAIAIGCFKMGLSIWWIVVFFVANTANNFVSFNYNATFGFDSDKGNQLFRDYMDKKGGYINAFFKNIIDPTSNYFALVAFTFRYFIAVGCLCNIMPLCFIVMTIISNIKWIVMYTLYALHLMGDKSLYVLEALAILDEERKEFYDHRSSGS